MRTQKARRWSIIGTMATVLWWGIASLAWAQEDAIIARGRVEYQRSCAVCHGEQGNGNGPMAELLRITRPADLTQIRQRNGGQFPFWRIYRVIDGREEITGHGPRDMPIWGAQYRMIEKDDEDAVQGRIWQLIYYLQSIQEE